MSLISTFKLGTFIWWWQFYFMKQNLVQSFDLRLYMETRKYLLYMYFLFLLTHIQLLGHRQGRSNVIHGTVKLKENKQKSCSWLPVTCLQKFLWGFKWLMVSWNCQGRGEETSIYIKEHTATQTYYKYW